MAERAKLHLKSVLAALARVEDPDWPRSLTHRRDLVQQWLGKVRGALDLVRSKAEFDATVDAHLDGGRTASRKPAATTVLHLDTDAPDPVVWVFRGEAVYANGGKAGPGGHVVIALNDPKTRARKLRRNLKVEPGASGMHVFRLRLD